MRILTATAVAVVLAAAMNALPAGAQGQAARTPNETTRAEKSRGGTDPNVKQDRQAVVAGDRTTVAAPPAKGATATERSRQISMCTVMVDNWTPYAVDVYVDSSYRGTMPAWGELYTAAIAGPTLLYGRSAGGTLTWGPRTVGCTSSYTWRLDP